MWTTVFVATGKEWATEIEEKLRQEGFLIKVKYFAIEGGEELYEILAPAFEVEDVQSAMMDLGIL